MNIRALRPDDDRSSFHSGDSELDRFFAKYAGQNQFRHHVGATYIAVEDPHILGFVTIAAGQLESEARSPVLGRKQPPYPLPVLRLARMAVASAHQRKGVGKHLLLSVFDLALAMSARYGCVGILVDAKPGAVTFYAHFGFTELVAIAGTMHVAPAPVPMFISVAKLKQA